MREEPKLGRLLLLPIAATIIFGCARGVAAPNGSGDGADASASASVAEKPRLDANDASSNVVSDASAVGNIPPRTPAVVQIDPDGNDDEEDPGTGKAPTSGRWERVGTPPLALTRICDLTPLDGALYAAHAHQPLGTDGATITRYRPNPDDEKKNPFSVAFDWNRPGEPVKGGGAGQGFVRVRNIGGRLFVPDADPPYGGLGLVDGAEGYVFISDDKGAFAPARAPHFQVPRSPELRVEVDGGAAARSGAGIIPRAYHVLDVIRYRGAIYVSTGSVPPKERAWNGPSPGALHRSNESGTRWAYETDYPYPWKDGVWRLTYMVRFKDRLYAGIQDYDGRDPNDFIWWKPDAASADAGATVLRREDAHPTRITRVGASGTLRWWVDTRAQPARLYWLAWTRDGILLRVTTDGDRWAIVPLPDDAGRPTDVTRFRDAVVVLTERGLYRVQGKAIDGAYDIPADGVADAQASLIASVEDPPSADAGAGAGKKPKKSPFEITDFFCTAPLGVLNNTLYAGAQRGGSLYRLVD